jgi:plastocyanin
MINIIIKGQSSLIYLSLFLYLVSSLFFVAAQEITIKVTNTQAMPVEGMVVYLTPKNIQHSFPNNPSTLVVTQKNKSFAPYVAVTQKGQSIAFENQDNIAHHIYSVSGGNRFDFKVKAGNSKSTQELNHAEEIAMGCNIHDWMSGYVLVVDTPFYTQTNSEGLATIKLSVAGDYTLTIWHPHLDVKDYKLEQTITFANNIADSQRLWEIKLPKNLLALPEQVEQDEFEFLDEYK